MLLQAPRARLLAKARRCTPATLREPTHDNDTVVTMRYDEALTRQNPAASEPKPLKALLWRTCDA
jgi:hypothetical protein